MTTMKAEINRLYDKKARAIRRNEKIEYLRALLGELRTMAEAERCDMLAYLIEMAYVEANDILRGSQPFRIETEGPHSKHAA